LNPREYKPKQKAERHDKVEIGKIGEQRLGRSITDGFQSVGLEREEYEDDKSRYKCWSVFWIAANVGEDVGELGDKPFSGQWKVCDLTVMWKDKDQQ
jgi:hypothetical protein